MAAKKKSKKKSAGKTTKAKSKRPAKPKASQKKSARRGATAKRAKKASPKKAQRAKASTSSRAFPAAPKTRPALTDTDSQGLSQSERADSESVSELVDEGNTFEAGVVSGVERADDAEGREVRTREFPEDDVPEEYLDQDE